MAKAKKEKMKAESELHSVQTNMRDLLAAKNKALEETKKNLLEAQAAAAALATVEGQPGGSKTLVRLSFPQELHYLILVPLLGLRTHLSLMNSWNAMCALGGYGHLTCTSSVIFTFLDVQSSSYMFAFPPSVDILFSIPDCGHTFCESCLIEWFGVTHAQFMQDHAVNPMHHEILYILDQVSRTPAFLTSRNIIDVLRARLPPIPKYTCPSCRGPVTSRPVEDYSLKQVVHKVAEALGERPPPSKSAGRHGKSTTGGIWDGFFPPIPKA